MNQVKEYQMPLLIAGGALVVAIILWVVLVAPLNTKLSNLQTQNTTLQAQEASLQARLTALQSEGEQLSGHCADLHKISTQIPSVQSPTDIDAEESSFEDQFNTLAGTSGVTLAQFSGFTPASTTGAPTAQPTTGGAPTSPTGVTAVPTTLTVQGNYGQITNFVNGLDSFPRLFVIQRFVLATGPASTSPGGASSASGAASGSAGVVTSGPPLWTGGQATSPSSGPYNLLITGSIYYTSTPNALAACDKATAAQAAKK